MISRVKIENYKSIESAEFEARRVNVFIGEPNSGKSNLLEAIGFLGSGVPQMVKELFRVRQTADLFFDREIEKPIYVFADGLRGWFLSFNPSNEVFEGKDSPDAGAVLFRFNRTGDCGDNPYSHSALRYYRYRALGVNQSENTRLGVLQPPYGANLPNLLLTNKIVRESISTFFQEKGFRLELRPQDNEIQMTKDVDGVLYSFPFESISETMRRIVFYKAALESNKDAILVFDEPESNTFPFYTKYLAERIALDESNQFFLTTHNPYVLMSIIEKTPSVDLAVYVTRMKNYRTEVCLLDSTQLGEALELGMSVFFNLDSYFGD